MKYWIPVFLDESVTYTINAQAYLAPLKKMAEAHIKYNDTVDKSVAQTRKLTKAGEEYNAVVTKQITPTKELAQTINIAADGQVTLANRTKDTTAALTAQAAAAKKVAQAQSVARRETQKGVANQFKGFSGKGALAGGATPKEVIDFKQQKLALRNLAAEYNLTAGQTQKFYSQVLNGTVAVTEKNRNLIAQVQRTERAYKSLGATAKKQSSIIVADQQRVLAAHRAEADQIRKTNAEKQRAAILASQARSKQIEQTRRAQEASKVLLISWQSFVRLITVQLIHRSISAIAVAIREGVNKATELAVKIAEIQTISQNIPQTFDRWADGLGRLSTAFGFDILDTAEAAYQSLSNQIAEGADTFRFLQEASQLALATVSDQSTAVLALTGILNAYNLEASYARDVSAALFKTVELGRLRLTEIGNSIGDVAVLASQLNISYQELFATIDTLTIQGIAYNKSQTQLRGLFTKLIKPTEDMKKLFVEMGVATGEQAIETFGLSGFLEILRDRTKGSSTELAKYVNRIRGITAALVLTGDGFATYRKNLKETQSAQESFDRAVSTVLENQGKKLQININELKNYFINDLGRGLVRRLQIASDSVGGFIVLIEAVGRTIRVALIGGLAQFIVKSKLMQNVNKASTASFLTLKAQATATGQAIKTAMAANWVGLVIVGVQTTIELVQSLQRKSIEASKEMSRAYEDAWKTYAEEAEKAINKSIDFIVESSRIIANETIAQASLATGGITKQANETAKFLENMGKSLKKAQSENIKVLTADITKLKKVYSEAETEFVKASEAIIQLRREASSGLFEIRLEGLEDPKDKIELIKQRVAGLASQLKSATTVERSRKLIKEIVALEKERASINKESADTNEDNAKRRVKLLKDAKKIENDLTKKQLQVDKKKSRDARAKPGRKDPQIDLILKTIEEEKKALQEKLKNNKTELEGLKDIYADKFDLENRFIKLNKLGLRVLGDIQKEAAQTAIGTQKKLQAEVKKKLDLERSYKAFTDSQAKIATISTETDESAIRSAAGEALKAIDNLRKAQISLDRDSSTSRIALTELEFRVRRDTEDRIKQIALDAELAKARLAKKRVEEEQGALKQTNANLTERVIDAARIWKEQTGLLPLKISDDLRELLESSLVIQETEKVAKGLVKGIFPAEEFNKLFNAYDAQLERLRQLENAFKQADIDLVDTLKKQGTIQGQIELFGNNISATDQALKNLTASSQRLADLLAVANPQAPQAPEGPLANGGFITKALGGAIQTFANGSKVQMGSDTVPAMLSPGEFVMNKGASRKFYSQLQAMNAGVSRFANGGETTNNSFGDFNISMEGSGSSSSDVIQLGHALRREVRRGTIKLTR